MDVNFFRPFGKALKDTVFMIPTITYQITGPVMIVNFIWLKWAWLVLIFGGKRMR